MFVCVPLNETLHSMSVEKVIKLDLMRMFYDNSHNNHIHKSVSCMDVWMNVCASVTSKTSPYKFYQTVESDETDEQNVLYRTYHGQVALPLTII